MVAEVFLPTSDSRLTCRPVERVHAGPDLAAPVLGDLEDADRSDRSVAAVADDLQPAPLEPARTVSKPAPGLLRGYHVDSARVEEQRVPELVHPGPVGVAVHDHVGQGKLAPDRLDDPAPWPDQPQAEGAQQRHRLLDEVAAV